MRTAKARSDPDSAQDNFGSKRSQRSVTAAPSNRTQTRRGQHCQGEENLKKREEGVGSQIPSIRNTKG